MRKLKFYFKHLPRDRSCFTVVITPCLVFCRKGAMVEIGVLWLNWNAMAVIGVANEWSVAK